MPLSSAHTPRSVLWGPPLENQPLNGFLLAAQPKQSGKRKRLQKGSGKSKGSSSAAGEEGVVYENAYEDADKDSIDGSEAMEDNTMNEDESGNLVIKKKHRGGAPQIPRQQMNEEIRALQDRMEQAQREDEEALSGHQPAVMKVRPAHT